MKTINHFLSKDENKKLVFQAALITFIIGGAAIRSVNFQLSDDKKIDLEAVYNDQYSDFDKVHIPHHSYKIGLMIKTLRPELSEENVASKAELLAKVFQGTKINPQIAVTIIDTESVFNQRAVSSTGDLSLAQINPQVWSKEFERLNLEPLDVERLKVDEEYSLTQMAIILEILKKRHAKTDRRWYARYHSHSKKYKRIYLAKLDQRMKILEKAKVHQAKPHGKKWESSLFAYNN
jgi:hypothetical protein